MIDIEKEKLIISKLGFKDRISRTANHIRWLLGEKTDINFNFNEKNEEETLNLISECVQDIQLYLNELRKII